MGGCVRVRSVAAGTDHTIGLTTDGRAFSFGRGQAGQLGSGNRRDRTQPGEMPLLDETAPHASEPLVTISHQVASPSTATRPAVPTSVSTAGASGSWRIGADVSRFTAAPPAAAPPTAPPPLAPPLDPPAAAEISDATIGLATAMAERGAVTEGGGVAGHAAGAAAEAQAPQARVCRVLSRW